MNPIVRAAAFVLTGMALFAALAAVSERTDPVYAEMRELWQGVESRGGAAEVLLVGNSHSRAIDLEALGMRGLPLWRGGGDLFEAAYLTRRAAPHLPRLKYLLVTASFSVLEMDNAAAKETDLTGRRVEIYARVPGWPPLPGDAESFVRGKVSPVVRPDHWARVLRPGRRREADEDRSHLRRAVRMDSHAEMRVRAARERTADMRRGRPDLRAAVVAELDGLIREMKRAGVQVVLYTPPFHPAYSARYDTAAANRVRRTMQALAARHPNAVYWDASLDPAFTRHEEYFLNSDHLNEQGARAFSAALRQRLEEPGPPLEPGSAARGSVPARLIRGAPGTSGVQ